MDAIELLARFSYRPALLVQCKDKETGKALDAAKLYNYILTRAEQSEAQNQLRKFPTMMPYLELIANKTGRDVFEYSVGEAYWIGNGLLDKPLYEDIKKMLSNPKIPEDAVPHHSLSVLLSGAATEIMDKCLITWGRIKEIKETGLRVRYQALQYNNRYYLAPKEKTIGYDKALFPDLKIDDIAAIHWEFAVKRLGRQETDNLTAYTLKNIEAVNSSLRENILQKEAEQLSVICSKRI